MKRRISRYLLCSLTSLVCVATAATAASETPSSAASAPAWQKAPAMPVDAPNVIVILLDDTAYALASTFGGPVATPARSTGATGPQI